jgi:hypothetical protein
VARASSWPILSVSSTAATEILGHHASPVKNSELPSLDSSSSSRRSASRLKRFSVM